MEAVNNTVKANKRICETFFEELHNRANLDIIDELVDTNVVSHDPFPGQLPGQKGSNRLCVYFDRPFRICIL